MIESELVLGGLEAVFDRIAGPAFGQVQGPIDKGMTASGHIGGEHTIWQFVILPAEPVY